MKKLLALLLALIMLLSLAACGKGDDTPDNPDTPGTSQGGEENKGNQSNEGNNNDNNSNQSANGSLSQAQMEAELLKRLSAISDLKSLTLCGGESITYTEDGMFFAGDYWTIKKPNMSYAEFSASLKAQLTAAGFQEDVNLFGTDYTVKAGTGAIGISVIYTDDPAELILRTTNFRDEYSQAFIAAENAKLPTIIEGVDIIDKLPENFSITFKTISYEHTICRYNGGYFISQESLDQEGADLVITSYDAALPNGDGSYTYYDWHDSLYPASGKFQEGKPQQTPYFMSQGSKTVEEIVLDMMDELSIWNRMSWEYKGLAIDENRFWMSMTEYSITENMVKTGNETYLGRNCEKVHSEGTWADTYDITFDLETGMVMKMTLKESGRDDVNTIVEVLEYNTAPTSLGTFQMP